MRSLRKYTQVSHSRRGWCDCWQTPGLSPSWAWGWDNGGCPSSTPQTCFSPCLAISMRSISAGSMAQASRHPCFLPPPPLPPTPSSSPAHSDLQVHPRPSLQAWPVAVRCVPASSPPSPLALLSLYSMPQRSLPLQDLLLLTADLRELPVAHRMRPKLPTLAQGPQGASPMPYDPRSLALLSLNSWEASLLFLFLLCMVLSENSKLT